MQIGQQPAPKNGWDDADIEDFIAQFTEVQTTLESIESHQNSISTALGLIEEGTPNLIERSAKTHDYQLFTILLFTMYFGYHISHYFLFKPKQIGGPG